VVVVGLVVVVVVPALTVVVVDPGALVVVAEPALSVVVVDPLPDNDVVVVEPPSPEEVVVVPELGVVVVEPVDPFAVVVVVVDPGAVAPRDPPGPDSTEVGVGAEPLMLDVVEELGVSTPVEEAPLDEVEPPDPDVGAPLFSAFALVS
jgi:hypothetical protein